MYKLYIKTVNKLFGENEMHRSITKYMWAQCGADAMDADWNQSRLNNLIKKRNEKNTA